MKLMLFIASEKIIFQILLSEVRGKVGYLGSDDNFVPISFMKAKATKIDKTHRLSSNI